MKIEKDFVIRNKGGLYVFKMGDRHLFTNLVNASHYESKRIAKGVMRLLKQRGCVDMEIVNLNEAKVK